MQVANMNVDFQQQVAGKSYIYASSSVDSSKCCLQPVERFDDSACLS